MNDERTGITASDRHHRLGGLPRRARRPAPPRRTVPPAGGPAEGPRTSLCWTAMCFAHLAEGRGVGGEPGSSWRTAREATGSPSGCGTRPDSGGGACSRSAPWQGERRVIPTCRRLPQDGRSRHDRDPGARRWTGGRSIDDRCSVPDSRGQGLSAGGRARHPPETDGSQRRVSWRDITQAGLPLVDGRRASTAMASRSRSSNAFAGSSRSSTSVATGKSQTGTSSARGLGRTRCSGTRPQRRRTRGVQPCQPVEDRVLRRGTPSAGGVARPPGTSRPPPTEPAAPSAPRNVRPLHGLQIAGLASPAPPARSRIRCAPDGERTARLDDVLGRGPGRRSRDRRGAVGSPESTSSRTPRCVPAGVAGTARVCSPTS